MQAKELIFEYNLNTDFSKRAELLDLINKRKVNPEIKQRILDIIKSSNKRSEKRENYGIAAKLLEKVQQDLIWETGMTNGKLWYIEVSEIAHRFNQASK